MPKSGGEAVFWNKATPTIEEVCVDISTPQQAPL